MRTSRRLLLPLFLLLLPLGCLAADLKVNITDPRAAVVAGARLALYPSGRSVAVAIQATSGEGNAVFAGLPPGDYRLEVLAPGFAPKTVAVTVPRASLLEVRLAIAGAAEAVVVTATRTPIPVEESGSDVGSLDHQALADMQPVAASDALRFLPGAVVNAAGRRGSLASLFVRGGESRYNKVIVDGVAINEPGGTFDFGVVPMEEVERLEFVRGAQSTLYGSDAMTSVLQLWSASGHTRVPELRFGAEGGTFSSARGFASLSQARGRLDYNLFGEQDASHGQGINDTYSNSSQGANLGLLLSNRAFFRLRARHANSRSGVQSAWNFNGQPLLEPDSDQFTRQNNFLASAELSLAAPARWQHRFSGFEYSHRRSNIDSFSDPGRALAFDSPFSAFAHINRAGFEYEGEFSPVSWARTTWGYAFEDENGSVGELLSGAISTGLRRNHAFYAEQVIRLDRVSIVGGFRYVHNESFNEDRIVPRVALTLLALRGGDRLSGTRLRFSYAEGIKEPRLEESFGNGGGFPVLPNPFLKPEETRAFEAGIQQNLAGGKYALVATYFHNRFRNQIDFNLLSCFCTGQYVNVNAALAHGAEVEFRGRIRPDLELTAAYVHTSTQILEQPFAFDPLLSPGRPLLRRPKHSGSLLLAYSGRRWGGNLGGSFVGRRPDSDFLGFGINHTAGYARVDAGAWFALNRYATAYVNVENLLNRRYEEVTGYPALKVNFRAGMRFRIGAD